MYDVKRQGLNYLSLLEVLQRERQGVFVSPARIVGGVHNLDLQCLLLRDLPRLRLHTHRQRDYLRKHLHYLENVEELNFITIWTLHFHKCGCF